MVVNVWISLISTIVYWVHFQILCYSAKWKNIECKYHSMQLRMTCLLLYLQMNWKALKFRKIYYLWLDLIAENHQVFNSHSYIILLSYSLFRLFLLIDKGLWALHWHKTIEKIVLIWLVILSLEWVGWHCQLRYNIIFVVIRNEFICHSYITHISNLLRMLACSSTEDYEYYSSIAWIRNICIRIG